ncbi:MAG: PQQ-binding-like beta-propeller repeat protein [Myxococcales bacterium]|nr:PQQ-binding-like beta-propeller repeat protein [Myxococcales bacterium]
MHRVLLLAIVFLSGCRGPTLSDAPAVLEGVPTTLDFGRVAVGSTRSRTLVLEGRASGTLTTTSPFSVDSPAFITPTDRTVVFAPTQQGAFESVLTLTSDALELRVELHGEGVTRTSCAADDPCVEASWSDDAAACVSAPRSEGSSCSAACVVDGRCQAGVCRGLFATCDDGDACTADACEPSAGCLHSPVRCGSDDPCQAARCDSKLGCVTSALDDGVACGPRDCSTAKICLGGACVERPVPDGESCGPSSVCQAAGVCSGGACQQQPPTALSLAWQHRASGEVDFPGLTDAAGNLFWFECGAPCVLVSVTPAGTLRYAVPTGLSGLASRYRAPAPAIVSGEAIIIASNGEVEARRHSDGVFLWRTVLPLRGSSERRQVSGLAAREPNALFVAGVFRSSVFGGYEPNLARLDLRHGRLQWERRFPAVALGSASIPLPSVAVIHFDLVVFAGEYTPGVGGRVIGLDPANGQRWFSSVGAVSLLEVVGDRVFHSGQGWLGRDGQAHSVPRFQNTMFPTALQTDAGVVLVGVRSHFIELMSEATGWQKTSLLDFMFWPPRTTTPRVSAAGAISFTHQSWSNGPVLYDFAPDGAPLAECRFSVSPLHRLDFSQPVVELPHLIVMTDDGRRTVHAFSR